MRENSQYRIEPPNMQAKNAGQFGCMKRENGWSALSLEKMRHYRMETPP
jgi:hypothetical protein